MAERLIEILLKIRGGDRVRSELERTYGKIEDLTKSINKSKLGAESLQKELEGLGKDLSPAFDLDIDKLFQTKKGLFEPTKEEIDDLKLDLSGLDVPLQKFFSSLYEIDSAIEQISDLTSELQDKYEKLDEMFPVEKWAGLHKELADEIEKDEKKIESLTNRVEELKRGISKFEFPTPKITTVPPAELSKYTPEEVQALPPFKTEAFSEVVEIANLDELQRLESEHIEDVIRNSFSMVTREIAPHVAEMYKTVEEPEIIQPEIKSEGAEKLTKVFAPIMNAVSSISERAIAFFERRKVATHEEYEKEKILKGLEALEKPYLDLETKFTSKLPEMGKEIARPIKKVKPEITRPETGEEEESLNIQKQQTTETKKQGNLTEIMMKRYRFWQSFALVTMHFLRSIGEYSKITGQAFESAMRIFGALIDVFLMPFLPAIAFLLKLFAKFVMFAYAFYKAIGPSAAFFLNLGILFAIAVARFAAFLKLAAEFGITLPTWVGLLKTIGVVASSVLVGLAIGLIAVRGLFETGVLDAVSNLGREFDKNLPIVMHFFRAILGPIGLLGKLFINIATGRPEFEGLGEAFSLWISSFKLFAVELIKIIGSVGGLLKDVLLTIFAGIGELFISFISPDLREGIKESIDKLKSGDVLGAVVSLAVLISKKIISTVKTELEMTELGRSFVTAIEKGWNIVTWALDKAATFISALYDGIVKGNWDPLVKWMGDFFVTIADFCADAFVYAFQKKLIESSAVFSWLSDLGVINIKPPELIAPPPPKPTFLESKPAESITPTTGTAGKTTKMELSPGRTVEVVEIKQLPSAPPPPPPSPEPTLLDTAKSTVGAIVNTLAAVNPIVAGYQTAFNAVKSILPFQEGGTITSTGLALVHKGETIVPAKGNIGEFTNITNAPQVIVHNIYINTQEVDPDHILDVLRRRWKIEYDRVSI